MYAYDPANQLTMSQDTSGITAYTFDSRGNQQIVTEPGGSRTTYTWEYDNQPTLVELLNGTRVTMAYNAVKRRVQKET